MTCQWIDLEKVKSYRHACYELAWKKPWLVSLLELIIARSRLKLPTGTSFYSAELFEYHRQVDNAIENTLYHIDWRAVHTNWKEALLEKENLIPVLADYDIEWTKAVMEDKLLLNDILSFETVNFVFKYELYGLCHEDLNNLFDIQRPGLWAVGIDEVDFL